MRARIQLHSRITTSKKSNECNTQDEAMQRTANTIIGCRGMFLLSPTTNAHTCTAGIKKGTDQRIHVQDTCADQWPETAAQTLRFGGVLNDLLHTPRREPETKKARIREPEKCGRKTAPFWPRLINEFLKSEAGKRPHFLAPGTKKIRTRNRKKTRPEG